tara:strand:- start:384 stop:968 length:585 start_codon:yes stop_codon:yes gene_type:complete
MSNHLLKKTYTVFVDGENYGGGNAPGGPVTGLQPTIVVMIGMDSGRMYHTAPYNFTMDLTEIDPSGGAPYIGGLYKFTIDWSDFDPSNKQVSESELDKNFYVGVHLDPGGGTLGNQDDMWQLQISADDIAGRLSTSMLHKLYEMETGDWQIEDNELSIKKENKEVARYKLYDKAGSPTNTNVFKRTLASLSDLT